MNQRPRGTGGRGAGGQVGTGAPFARVARAGENTADNVTRSADIIFLLFEFTHITRSRAVHAATLRTSSLPSATAKMGEEYAQFTSCDVIAEAGGCVEPEAKVACCATCALPQRISYDGCKHRSVPSPGGCGG